MKWVSFEGGISEGKTTLLKQLSTQYDNSCIAYEPVEEWEASGMLKMSYEDKTYIFPSQCDFFDSRISAFNKVYDQGLNDGKRYIFSERSPFSDKVFWQLRHKRDKMDNKLFDLYNRLWIQWQRLTRLSQPSLFVLLRASSTDICFDRLRERDRDAEKSVSFEYLDSLRHEHDEVFNPTTGVKMPDGTIVPVMVIETDSNFRDDPNELQKISEQILARLAQLEE